MTYGTLNKTTVPLEQPETRFQKTPWWQFKDQSNLQTSANYPFELAIQKMNIDPNYANTFKIQNNITKLGND